MTRDEMLAVLVVHPSHRVTPDDEDVQFVNQLYPELPAPNQYSLAQAMTYAKITGKRADEFDAGLKRNICADDYDRFFRDAFFTVMDDGEILYVAEKPEMSQVIREGLDKYAALVDKLVERILSEHE